MDLEAIAAVMGLKREDLERLEPERAMHLSSGTSVARSVLLQDLFCASCVRHRNWEATGDWLKRRGAIDLSPPIELIRSDGFLFELAINALDDAIVQAAIDEALP